MDSEPWTAPGSVRDLYGPEVLSDVKVAVTIIQREGILLQMVRARYAFYTRTFHLSGSHSTLFTSHAPILNFINLMQLGIIVMMGTVCWVIKQSISYNVDFILQAALSAVLENRGRD